MTPQTAPAPVRLLYFWIGILATLAYRAIIVLERLPGPWLKTAWYIGTVGFVVYFAHRYIVSERRARVIHERRLEEKVATSQLAPEDRAALAYILRSLETTKEKWNYVAIFVTSGVALAVGIILDLLNT